MPSALIVNVVVAVPDALGLYVTITVSAIVWSVVGTPPNVIMTCPLLLTSTPSSVAFLTGMLAAVYWLVIKVLTFATIKTFL